jgi:repressor LexA
MVKDGSEYFALRIKGQSMEPKISDGDVVIVRCQHNIDNGQIAIVCVNGDQATCKKVVKQTNGILLVPFNPAFETAFYTNEQIESIPITILGRVIELRAKF